MKLPFGNTQGGRLVYFYYRIMLRNEFKYFVHNSKMETLRNMILPFVKYDKFSQIMPEKHYTVRSIYFDTQAFDFYFEKVEGLKHRKKFRLRGYNTNDGGSDLVFFEIKRKYEQPILKNRAPVSYNGALEIFRGGQIDNFITNTPKFPVAIENANRFFFHYYQRHLRPVILVIYEREAFVGVNDNTIRVTFDKNLRGVAFPSIDKLYSEERSRSSLKDYFILEVKFNDYYPSWMKPIIGILGLHRQSASKYVITIDTQNFINTSKLPNTFSHTQLFNNKVL